jgi:TadE-like protein
MKRFVRDDRGGAMVEFALVAPILFMLLIGIFDMARGWYEYQVITDAAREGARRAVVHDGADKVGTANAPGTVPSVILQRMAFARMNLTNSWAPANHTANCAGWTPPAPPTSGVSKIYGCGWGGQPGTDARVVIYTPHPFAFLRPLAGVVTRNANLVNATVLQSNYVMRNE